MVERLASCMQITCHCCESEEDLRVMLGRFIEMYKGRGLKANASKSKMIVLEWRLCGLFYLDDLVSCVESKEDLRVMIRSLV